MSSKRNTEQWPGTVITDEILEYGYIHNNVGNFYKNYKRLSSEAKYGAYIDNFWNNAKNTALSYADSVNLALSSLPVDIDSLIEEVNFSKTQQALKDFRYAPGKKRDESKESAEQLKKVDELISILNQRQNYLNNCLISGSLSIEELKQSKIELDRLNNILNQIKTFKINKDFVFSDLDTGEQTNRAKIGGNIAEFAAAAKIQEVLNSFLKDFKIEGNVSVLAGNESSTYGNPDIKVSFNDKEESQSYSINAQIKNTKDNKLYTKFDKNSFEWDNSFQDFLPFLYYYINNINALNAQSSEMLKIKKTTNLESSGEIFGDGKKMLEKLWQGILLNGIVRGILIGNKISNQKNDSSEWNSYLIMLGPDDKIIKYKSSDLIKMAISTIDSQGTIDGASVNQKKDLSSYIENTVQKYSGAEMRSLRNRKINLSNLLGSDPKGNFYDYVIGKEQVSENVGEIKSASMFKWKMNSSESRRQVGKFTPGGRYKFLERAGSLNIIVPIERLYKDIAK
jgi:hypothetical protein